MKNQNIPSEYEEKLTKIKYAFNKMSNQNILNKTDVDIINQVIALLNATKKI